MHISKNTNAKQILYVNNGQILLLKDLSPVALGRHGISKDIVIRPFNYVEQNRNLKSFDRTILGKICGRRGLVALQFFRSLKADSELLISVRMSLIPMF